MIKNYIGISRDHSQSMFGLTTAARNDYNSTIEVIRDNALKHNQDTIVNVVKCGTGRPAKVEREIVNSDVRTLVPMTSYVADGNATPLFDSVGELIEMMQKVPDADDPNVSFLVVVVTDGGENSSSKWRTKLGSTIRELQATDRWSFAFRVPRGYKNDLVRLGIPEGNILEWDTTQKGMEQSTTATQQAFSNYYNARASGTRSVKGFYSTNLLRVDPKTVQSELKDISKEVIIANVTREMEIIDFVQNILMKTYRKGCAFYELTKYEKAVQDYKKICIEDKKNGKIFEGINARKLLNLPEYGTISLSPGSHGDYTIYIQSTSTNRKLKPNSRLLYWTNA